MILAGIKGRSFKGLGLYLLHDLREPGEATNDTDARVSWTDARNTLEVQPEAVIREMQMTALNRDLLRRLNGDTASGRPLKHDVLHLFMAWHVEQQPTPAQMRAAADSLLAHLGAAEHQALYVAHDDKAHAHLHLVVNRVHPITGQALADGWFKNDMAKWALAYEKSHGKIYCAERQKRAEGKPHRDLHMPRWQYEEWKKTNLSREAYFEQIAQREGQRADLKAEQRAEREGFFRDAKEAVKGLRAEVWEAVRQEFAPRWQAYAKQRAEGEAERAGFRQALKLKLRQAGYRDWAPQLRRAEQQHAADLKAEATKQRAAIQADQSARFEQVNTVAFDRFKEAQRDAYKLVLARQRGERAEARAEVSLSSPPPRQSGATPSTAWAAMRAQAVDAAVAMPPGLARAENEPITTVSKSGGSAKDRPIATKQGSRSMFEDEDQKKKPTAAANLDSYIFTPPIVPPAPTIILPAPPDYERTRTHLAEAEAARRAAASRDDGQTQERAARSFRESDQQRARERQGYPPPPRTAQPEPKAPPVNAGFHSTEHRPANWHGGTPQYGFGFTPGSPPGLDGIAIPARREHPAPQMERYPRNAPVQGDHARLAEAIRDREAARARTQAEEQARYSARTAFSDGRPSVVAPNPERAQARSEKAVKELEAERARQALEAERAKKESEAERTRTDFKAEKQITEPDPRREVSPRRAAMMARYGASHEVTDRAPVEEPKREFASRREAMAARYSPGREVSDRMAASSARVVENTDRRQERSERTQEVTDRSARRQAMMDAASKGVAPERDNERDR